MPVEGRKQEEKEQVNESPIAVLFVPYTEGAVLAKKYREYEQQMKGPTGWYLKIVERAGDSLVDLLHRSDPWSGDDCKRKVCLQCQTKLKTGKNLTQDCSKRNCIYETWCISCEERDRNEIEERAAEDERLKKDLLKNMKIFK